MGAPLPALPTLDIGRVERALADGGEPLAVLREALADARTDFADQFAAGRAIRELVYGRARFVDQLLDFAWRLLLPDATNDLALIAVGGYGRGELHPASDIDLLLLARERATYESHRSAIERFLALLWDLGVEVGHSVRSVAECVDEARRDVTIATNLTEARLVSGPPGLFTALRAATGPDRIWSGPAFFAAKWDEQQARHRKFHDTAYNLEPNIKESPGGLRDIQMVGWVAKRHFNAATLHDLVEHGFLAESEHHTLIEGQDHLWRIRSALHLLTGRREDRLLFDYQIKLARQFGFRDTDANLAVEQFMQSYYRTVMELSRLNEMLLQLFQEAILYADAPGRPVSINRRFQSRNGFIEAKHPKVFEHNPFALLEVFLLLEQHPELKGVRASTIRLIRDHRHRIDDRFRDDLRARSLFMEILRQPRGVTHELRRMNRYGILAAYLPPFGNVVGRMQYDLFHTYTVDEHTLFVIRNLRRLTVPEFADELPLCTRIMRELPKPELLYVAALFHDVAKGRGGDHSQLGAADAEEFCKRHGLSTYDTRLVCWLVRNHLLYSLTAQRRDIGDPQVIHEFASTLGDRIRLDYLYLLTVADIRATNPGLWNAWRDALLQELYVSTRRALQRGLENPVDKAERIREVQDEARAELRRRRVAERGIDEVWRNLSDDYFLRYRADEIAWHTEAIDALGTGEPPLVLVHPQSARGGTQIFLYTPASDHLFAATTAALDQLGLTITDARIVTARNGYTLDTYVVLEADGETIDQPYRLEEIRDTLDRALRTPESPIAVTRRARRHLRHFSSPTEIAFSQDIRNGRTVVELFTADHPGLLSRVGRAFQACGVQVQNAKVSTIGAQVDDVFFITDAHNAPLTDSGAIERLRQALEEALSDTETLPRAAP